MNVSAISYSAVLSKRQVVIQIVATALLVITSASAKGQVIHDSYLDLYAAVGDRLEFEDWRSYPTDTLLGGGLVNGIFYEPYGLVVGSSHGGGWLLGFAAGDGRYRSFSSQTISFTFSDSIDAFGISLSQGNSNGGVREVGYSLWSITVDGTDDYIARADFDLDDSHGETYLGIEGLGSANFVQVKRIFSTRCFDWNIKDIAYASRPSVERLLERLLEAAKGVGPGTSLADKITLAQTFYVAPDIDSTCAYILDFNRQVEAIVGKPILDSLIAEQLTSGAQEILKELSCQIP